MHRSLSLRIAPNLMNGTPRVLEERASRRMVLRAIRAACLAPPLLTGARPCAAATDGTRLPQLRLRRGGKGGSGLWLWTTIQPDGRAEAIWSDVESKIRSRRSGILTASARTNLLALLRQPELIRLLARFHDFQIYPEPVPYPAGLNVEHFNDTGFNLRVRRDGRPESNWTGYVEVTPPGSADLIRLLERSVLALPLVGVPDGYLEASLVETRRLPTLREARKVPIAELSQLPHFTHHALRSSARRPRDLVPITRPTLTALRAIEHPQRPWVTVDGDTYEFFLYSP